MRIKHGCGQGDVSCEKVANRMASAIDNRSFSNRPTPSLFKGCATIGDKCNPPINGRWLFTKVKMSKNIADFCSFCLKTHNEVSLIDTTRNSLLIDDKCFEFAYIFTDLFQISVSDEFW
jgi:hypothetical protein